MLIIARSYNQVQILQNQNQNPNRQPPNSTSHLCLVAWLNGPRRRTQRKRNRRRMTTWILTWPRSIKPPGGGKRWEEGMLGFGGLERQVNGWRRLKSETDRMGWKGGRTLDNHLIRGNQHKACARGEILNDITSWKHQMNVRETKLRVKG